jgi:hypothetical protein
MIRSTQGSFRQLALARTTPRAAVTSSSLLSSNNSQSPSLVQQPQDGSMIGSTSRRWNYQVFLTRRLDRKTGQYKYDDWEYLARGFQEPSLLSGETLLSRHLKQKEHIKPTEQNRRLNDAKLYRRSKKHVEDLTSYIQFVNQEPGDEKTKKKK